MRQGELASLAPEGRLTAARGILADLAHYAPAIIAEACGVVAALSDDPEEVTEVIALLVLSGPER